MSDADTEEQSWGLIYRNMWSRLLFVLAVGALLQSLPLCRWLHMEPKTSEVVILCGVFFLARKADKRRGGHFNMTFKPNVFLVDVKNNNHSSWNWCCEFMRPLNETIFPSIVFYCSMLKLILCTFLITLPLFLQFMSTLCAFDRWKTFLKWKM